MAKLLKCCWDLFWKAVSKTWKHLSLNAAKGSFWNVWEFPSINVELEQRHVLQMTSRRDANFLTGGLDKFCKYLRIISRQRKLKWGQDKFGTCLRIYASQKTWIAATTMFGEVLEKIQSKKAELHLRQLLEMFWNTFGAKLLKCCWDRFWTDMSNNWKHFCSNEARTSFWNVSEKVLVKNLEMELSYVFKMSSIHSRLNCSIATGINSGSV